MSAARGTALRTLEWMSRNAGTRSGSNKVRRWENRAGFSGEEPWCGIFLGQALHVQGLPIPKGYAAAANWANYGSAVRNLKEAQPGDVLVYGGNHVAMYMGGGIQIQGNYGGRVAESKVGPGNGAGPITAIRRPPFRGEGTNPMTPAEKRKLHELAGKEGGNSGIPGLQQFEEFEEHGGIGGLPGDILSGLTADLSSHAKAFMLNIALLGGGAFLVYYGAALLLGAKQPVATPVKAAAEAAALAPK